MSLQDPATLPRAPPPAATSMCLPCHCQSVLLLSYSRTLRDLYSNRVIHPSFTGGGRGDRLQLAPMMWSRSIDDALSLFSLPTIATGKPLLKVVSTTTCHSNVSLTCAPQPSVSWRPPLMHPRTLTLRAFYPRFQGLEERGLHSHEIACSSPACFCLLQLARPPSPSSTPVLVVSSFFICSRRLSCCPPLICEQYRTISSQTHLKLVSPIF